MELIDVDKQVLCFPTSPLPSGSLASDSLTITNVTATFVAFKMKTTNQPRYVVRPNMGVVPPHGFSQICVSLALTSKPPKPGPSRDKFMLMVFEAPPELAGAKMFRDFWTKLEQGFNSVRKVKFKVAFLRRRPSPQLSDSPNMTSLPKNTGAHTRLSYDTQDMTGTRLMRGDSGSDHETTPRRRFAMSIVEVDKRTLSFLIGAPGTVSSAALNVSNTTCKPVAFKMKINSPRPYIVRPSTGFIPPHASFVLFMGIRLTSDQRLPEPSRDKFLLQVIEAPGLLDSDLAREFWTRHQHHNVKGIKFPVQFVKACAEDGESSFGKPQSRSSANGQPFSDSDTSSDW